MSQYKFVKKGLFESLSKFEKKLNDTANSGWRVVNFSYQHGEMIVLLERNR